VNTADNTVRPSIKRWNPLLGEWTIIAPVTSGRPWSGTVVSSHIKDEPAFDPDCYLCPGVRRAGDAVNPDYTGVFVFNNDFPSLSMEYSIEEFKGVHPGDLPARGICRVVCFSPVHNLTLPEMETADIEAVLRVLCGEFTELSSIQGIENIMMFENRGKIIGVSNPHPHGQIYSTDFVPRIPWTMYSNARSSWNDRGRCLFCAVMEEELATGTGTVCQNDHFAAYVPFFARHTYEVHIMPRRHVPFITGLTGEELASLAAIYKEMLVRYDNLFTMPFPNITVFQNSPCGKDIDPEPYHFHIEFYPPMRSPDKLKYMAGFESGGGNIINPSVPAESAAALRSVPPVHYTKFS